jgi:hypothetical protein
VFGTINTHRLNFCAVHQSVLGLPREVHIKPYIQNRGTITFDLGTPNLVHKKILKHTGNRSGKESPPVSFVESTM